MENQMLQLEKAADCHASEGYWGFSAMLWQWMHIWPLEIGRRPMGCCITWEFPGTATVAIMNAVCDFGGRSAVSLKTQNPIPPLPYGPLLPLQGFHSGSKVWELYPDAVTRTRQGHSGPWPASGAVAPFDSFLFHIDLVEYVLIADAFAHIQQLWLKGMSSQQRNVGNINPSTRDLLEHSQLCSCLVSSPSWHWRAQKRRKKRWRIFCVQSEVSPYHCSLLPYSPGTQVSFRYPRRLGSPWFAGRRYVDFPGHPVFGESMFLCLVCLVCLFFVAPCLLATPRKSEPRSPIPRNAMTSVHPEVPPMDEMPQTEQPNVISLRNWSFNMALSVNVCN